LFHHVLSLQVSLQDRDRRHHGLHSFVKKASNNLAISKKAQCRRSLPDKLTRPLLLRGWMAHEQTARSD
jgi:hypothetical protein